MEGGIVSFLRKGSGFLGLAAGTLLMAGLGPLPEVATDDPVAAVITIQGKAGYFCVVPSVAERVFRCGFPAGNGDLAAPWLREPVRPPVHIPVLPGQGGKTLQSLA